MFILLVSCKWFGVALGCSIRCSVCVEQDVSVLQVLGIWAVLEVFLQAVAAFQASGWRDGRLVDGNVSHGGILDTVCFDCVKLWDG